MRGLLSRIRVLWLRASNASGEVVVTCLFSLCYLVLLGPFRLIILLQEIFSGEPETYWEDGAPVAHDADFFRSMK